MSEEIEDPWADQPEAPVVADTDDDPFSQTKAPAVSFKDAKPGTEVRFAVLEQAKMVQQRDFDSGELATWPDGNPKMAAVFRGEVNGETRSLWAPKPSALFNAIGDAQLRAGGQRIGPGDTLIVTMTGEQPRPSGKKGFPQKLYKAAVER